MTNSTLNIGDRAYVNSEVHSIVAFINPSESLLFADKEIVNNELYFTLHDLIHQGEQHKEAARSFLVFIGCHNLSSSSKIWREKRFTIVNNAKIQGHSWQNFFSKKDEHNSTTFNHKDGLYKKRNIIYNLITKMFRQNTFDKVRFTVLCDKLDQIQIQIESLENNEK